MRQRTGWMIAVTVAALVSAAWGGTALASPQCTALGPNAQEVPGACQIVGPITAPCPLTLTLPPGENLLIAAAGSLKCNDASPASAITITVPGGNMVMDPGSQITVENTAAAGGVEGGTIAITVSGDFLMRGTGSAANPLANGCASVAGACISTSDLAGGGGKAGNVTITVGNFPNTPPVGAFTMEPGSAVLANSTGGSGGEIVVTAGLQMHVDGLVRSFGGIGGTGANQPSGGGPIALKSGCALEVSPDGVISSEGLDAGADLVHLEACEVLVNGLVQSIAKGNGGHTLPAAGNKCNNDPVAHPLGGANAFTACVEIWGNTVTINSILPNKGEVSANGVTNNRAWIDVFAKDSVTITNDTVGPYSVHANSGPTTNDFGGVVTVKGQTGTYQSSGLAIQANSLAAGSDGGDVTIQASGNVALGNSSVQARGSAAGTNPAGGRISARSFHGVVSGSAPGELIASGGPPAGVITLQGCGTGAPGNDGVNYTGTTNPLFNNPGNACVGQPALPAATVAALATLAPICDSVQCGGGDCPKQGRKFNDLNNNHMDDGEPGLPGWQICAFDNGGTLVGQCQVTDANGDYEFSALVCGQTYTFCEVLQGSWTQTFPNVIGGNVASCAGLVGPGPLGQFGYRETLIDGQISAGNDFGNFLPGAFCPEDPDAVCTSKVQAGGFTTVQAAYNAASNGDVICLFGNTTENVVLNGNKSLTITQCTSARVTAASNSLPVWTISSTGALTIIGADAKNGSIGWLVTSGGHDIKAVRAATASQVGIKITGDSNKVSFNSVGGSPVGVRIEGSFNDVRGGTVSDNTAGAVQLGATASNNSFSGATVRNNTGVGILVSGPGNTIRGTRVYSNTGHGIHVTATAAGTKLKGNQSGNPENGGAEYQLDVGAVDLGGNRADGINIPKTSNPQKCPTFAAAGTCE